MWAFQLFSLRILELASLLFLPRFNNYIVSNIVILMNQTKLDFVTLSSQPPWSSLPLIRNSKNFGRDTRSAGPANKMILSKTSTPHHITVIMINRHITGINDQHGQPETQETLASWRRRWIWGERYSRQKSLGWSENKLFSFFYLSFKCLSFKLKSLFQMFDSNF